MAYWVSDRAVRLCAVSSRWRPSCDSRQGLITGNNDAFIRLWFEVAIARLWVCRQVEAVSIREGGGSL